MFVCYTNNHIRTCRGGGKSSALSSEEKTGELEEIAVIFSVDQHESCWCGWPDGQPRHCSILGTAGVRGARERAVEGGGLASPQTQAAEMSLQQGWYLLYISFPIGGSGSPWQKRWHATGLPIGSGIRHVWVQPEFWGWQPVTLGKWLDLSEPQFLSGTKRVVIVYLPLRGCCEK